MKQSGPTFLHNDVRIYAWVGAFPLFFTLFELSKHFLATSFTHTHIYTRAFFYALALLT